MAIVEIKNLDFAYNGEAVLKDVSLTVRQKDFMAIIGPNGGGKSTLLKLILGLLALAKGTIRVDGKSPQEASRCLGYVPQDVHTNRNFPITAIDVVLMGKLDPKKRFSGDSLCKSVHGKSRNCLSRIYTYSYGLVLTSAMPWQNSDAKRPGMRSHAMRGNEAEYG